MTEETYQKAASAAAAMLARRPLTEYQLRQKLLEKEFPEDAAEYAVARMQVLGALDDEAYAELYLRIGTRKGWGAMRIRQELRRRGVPPEIAGQVLEQFEPDWDKMTALLDKRLGGDCSDRSKRRRRCLHGAAFRLTRSARRYGIIWKCAGNNPPFLLTRR